jgi:hypothetical protein
LAPKADLHLITQESRYPSTLCVNLARAALLIEGLTANEVRQVWNEHRVKDHIAENFWSHPRGKAIAGSCAELLAQMVHPEASDGYSEAQDGSGEEEGSGEHEGSGQDEE